jgi:hypothetical protein
MISTAPATVPLADAARLLGMGVSTARRAEKAGTFPVPVLRRGTWLRVSVAAIDAYLGVAPSPASVPVGDTAGETLIRAEIAGLRAKLAVLEAAYPALAR